MSLRFFADHCIPNSVATALLLAGHEMVYLSAHSDMEHYRGRLFLVEVHRIRVRG